MIRLPQSGFTFLALLCLFTSSGSPAAWGQADLSGSDRTELVYFIGEITQVSGTTGTVNLGKCHALNLVNPVSKKIQQVAVFRGAGTIMKPVGIVSLIHAGSVSSRIKADHKTPIQVGDIVAFVRQVDELLNPDAHEDHVLRSIALRRKQVARRTTIERDATANLLSLYGRSYPKWEMSRSRVAGHFFGRPEGQLSPELEQLLKQVNLFRRYHADGFLSIKAAGPVWETTMGPLFGRDTQVKHQSATTVVQESDEANIPQFNVIKLKSVVDDLFFDVSPEGKNTVAFLTATALRVQPRSLDRWLQTQFLQTQFPHWSGDLITNDRIQTCVRKLGADN